MKIKIMNFFFLFFVLGIQLVFAVDKVNIINSSSSNDKNNLYFFTGSVNYVNKDSNSDIIGDYLSGSYYSTVYGFFNFIDVRFVGSTSKCSSGYGYKLDGKAYSESVGYIDFGYDDDTFVYYCMNDKKLHGKAYMPSIGEQIFDGISFDILPNGTPSYTPKSDTMFVNNTTIIFNKSPEQISKKHGQESIFYIWKPKKK